MACFDCLARGALLARLAANIERAAADRSGTRSEDILRLDDETLAEAMAPDEHAAVLEFARARAAELASELDAPGRPWAVCRHQPDFPGGLLALGRGAPRSLFGLGDRGLLRALEGDVRGARGCVAIVGARRASAYGREVAAALAVGAAGAGTLIVSGMAAGVDGAAHAGALEVGAATVAVLGSGPDLPYPPSHRRLHEAIADRGLVLSEMPPGSRPMKWCFPARNRIIAALGGATVVVEARRRSGSLITARLARELGRDVGAVPGPITSPLSRGTNALLADGAHPVLDVESLLDVAFGVGGRPAPEGGGEANRLAGTDGAVLEAIAKGCATPDAVSHELGLVPGEVDAALFRLEVAGRVAQAASGRLAVSSRGAKEG